jgi:CheY-like chemotaxis protein
MHKESERRQVILLLHDVDETRYLMEKMLSNDSHYVVASRNEEDAISRPWTDPPDVVLMNLGRALKEHLVIAQRIRDSAGLGANVAIVLFGELTIPEGAEVEVDRNIYATRPDSFSQLRDFLQRLLRGRHAPTC